MGCGISSLVRKAVVSSKPLSLETTSAPSGAGANPSVQRGTPVAGSDDTGGGNGDGDNQASAGNSPRSDRSDDGIKKGWFQEHLNPYAGGVLLVAAGAVALVPDPIGVTGVLSNALLLIKEHLQGADENTDNCIQLQETVKWSLKCLEGADSLKPEVLLEVNAVEEHTKLVEALNNALNFFNKFKKTNILQRAVFKGRHAEEFKKHNYAITEYTKRLTIRFALRKPPDPPVVCFTDDAADAVRGKLLELSGGGCDDIVDALELIYEKGLMAELSKTLSLSETVQLNTLAILEMARKEKDDLLVPLPANLPAPAKAFWYNNFNDKSVPFDVFFDCILIAVTNDLPLLVKNVHTQAEKVLNADSVRELLSRRTVVDADYQLLKQLLMSTLDAGGSGMVDVQQYNRLFFMCAEWSQQEQQSPPQDIAGCLRVLTCNFNPRSIIASYRREKANLDRHLQPIDFDFDICDLLVRFTPGSRAWFFDEYRSWLAKCNSDPGHRVLVLYGDTGIGKSTIAAALACNKDYTLSSRDDAGQSGDREISTMSAKDLSVVGCFFCRHDDDRRSNPVRLILTLAYQLGLALPELRPHLFAIDSKRIEEMIQLGEQNLDAAFKTLLRNPLGEIEDTLAGRSSPLVVVIDALDEVALLGAPNSKGFLMRNPLLVIIREYLVQLPKAIRFVITSRPENHIKLALTSSVHSVMTLRRDDQNHLEDLRQLIHHELNELLVKMEDTNAGMKVSEVAAASNEANGGDAYIKRMLDRAVQMLLKKSEGSFVYVARLLDYLRHKPRWSVEEIQEFPTDLFGTYEFYFQKHVGQPDSDKFDSMRKLLEVMLAFQEPPSMDLLSAVMALMIGQKETCLPQFSLSKTQGSSTSTAASGPVGGYYKQPRGMNPDAARSKVSSLLRQLGTLYTTRGSKVQVFHKSFHDWLQEIVQDDEYINPYRVTPLRGHITIASLLLTIVAPWIFEGASSAADVKLPLWASEYSWRFIIRHLVSISNTDTAMQQGLHARELLDMLTKEFSFLRIMCQKGLLHDLIQNLELLETKSTWIQDVLHWLLKGQHKLLLANTSEQTLIYSALGCPLETLVFKHGLEKAKFESRSAAMKRKHSFIATLHVLGPSTTSSDSSWTPGDGLVLEGHNDMVNCVSWSPDGKQLASCGGDYIVRVWNAVNGECLAELEGHSESVISVTWSRDGKSLASCSWDETVCLWDVADGECTAVLEGHADSVYSVSWSPDGKLLASGGDDKTVRLWDPAICKCKTILPGHTGAVKSVSWSPDSKVLASGSEDKSVRLWDCVSGECKATLEGHTDEVTAVLWNLDGKLLASCSKDGDVFLWDVTSAVLKSKIEGPEGWWMLSASWSPDGKMLATCSNDETVRLWNPETGDCIATLQGHSDWVTSVSWSPDGKTLASGSNDDTIRLWDAASSIALTAASEGHSAPVNSVSWSPDGKVLASCSNDTTVRLWNPDSGKSVAVLEGHSLFVSCVSFSPDGMQLATGVDDTTVRVWDVASGTCAVVLEGHSGYIRKVLWSPDGKTLASCGEDATVMLWDTNGCDNINCKATLQEHKFTVCSVAWSPDSKSLASCSEDQTIRLWDKISGVCTSVIQGFESSVDAVSWSPDGQTLACASETTWQLWDVATGICIRKMEGHLDYLCSLSWSPDGKMLATCSHDMTVRLWETDSGECTATLEGHAAAVYDVAWSPDGSRSLASCSSDKTVRIWVQLS